MSSPYIFGGLGTVFAYSTNDSSYTPVSDVVSIDGPQPEMGDVDTTNLGSSCKTKRPTLGDPGTCDVEIQYDPGDTSHAFLYSSFTGKTILYWKETLPTAALESTTDTVKFQGYIKSFPISGIEAEANISVKFSIQLVSMPVIATS